MKRFNWQNIRLVLIAFAMIFLYSFASKRNQNREVKDIKISFEEGQDNLFITHEMVNNLLIQNCGGAFPFQKVRVDLNTLESVLDDHEMIDKAQVFSSIDGSLSAHVKQKTPIVRLLSDNTSYYIDSKGTKMPLSENFSARVPLVMGEFLDEDKENYMFLFNEINKDDFLKKNITGIKILPSGGVIMMNRNYDFKIVFGKPIHVEQKLKNYKAFFLHAIKDTLIEEYKEVNLMFEEQVVCKK